MPIKIIICDENNKNKNNDNDKIKKTKKINKTKNNNTENNNAPHKICSWDVGIKNLAYCIIEKNNGEYKIIHWDVINFLNDDNDKCCGYILKSNKVCSSRAKFYGTKSSGETEFYCKRHSKFYKGIDDDNWETNFFMELSNDVINSKTDKSLCEYVLPKKGIPCEKKGCFFHKNKILCNSHKKTIANNFFKSCMLQKIKKKNAMSEKISNLARSMYEKLDSLSCILDVNEVLIENQPSLINPTMKTISSLLFGYFIMKNIVNEKNNRKTIKNIRFISPSNKLKVNSDMTLEVLKNQKGKVKYKLTKELGEKYTKILLKNQQEWLNHLSAYKKKDDMCDAFLQGYHYLYFNAK